MPLPVESAMPALSRALRERGVAVLQAPPGAGKTTAVPPALLGEEWLGAGKIVMLEPRRLAARAAARRMAMLRGEAIGDTVGYRVRLDTRVGPATRIEVVTEGVLTRMLEDDPSLEGVGAVIFDEFHERSLHADLGLALTLETRDILRPDLRLLVMSATLDGASVARLLGGAPVITSDAALHPVEIRHMARTAAGRIEGDVASVVRSALAGTAGDLLVFLPGAGEIRRVEALLAGSALPAGISVIPLHGGLSPAEQDAAIAPSPPGRRKIVLATSLAQTSLTIEGVTTVVDSGLSRVPRFSPRSGMTRLETIRVSRASADQRAGRAGRTGPGVCYRLWSEGDHATLLTRDTPEILEADLAPLALSLAAMGVTDAGSLRWLDPPPPAQFAAARELLRELGALDREGRITGRGREMAGVPAHPRIAHMLLASAAAGDGALAADIAALLAERDLLRRDAAPPPADLALRLDLLQGRGETGGADPSTLRRVREEARELRRQAGIRDGSTAPGDAGRVLALAYPDRVAQRRPGPAPRYLLRNGGGAALPEGDALVTAAYLVIAETDGRRPEARIGIAAPIERAELETLFAADIERERVVEWESGAGVLVARARRRLGAIVLEETTLRDVDPDAAARAVLDGIGREGIAALPWGDAAARLRLRVAFLRTLDDRWPDLSDAALLERLDEWLAPHVRDVRRRADLGKVDFGRALMGLVPPDLRGRLDALAPTHIIVPTGSRLPVDYTAPAAPALSVRLQEMFGVEETPAVGGGTVPLTLHLLSPAGRPVQVTRDLAGFWKSAYFDVRKDLRGRYPKHAWPEDPINAEPTRRTRRRGE